MDNSIYRQQNEREILLLQKAQRSKYTNAKRALYRNYPGTRPLTMQN